MLGAFGLVVADDVVLLFDEPARGLDERPRLAHLWSGGQGREPLALRAADEVLDVRLATEQLGPAVRKAWC